MYFTTVWVSKRLQFSMVNGGFRYLKRLLFSFRFQPRRDFQYRCSSYVGLFERRGDFAYGQSSPLLCSLCMHSSTVGFKSKFHADMSQTTFIVGE